MMQLISDAFPVLTPKGRMTLQGIRNSEYAQTPEVKLFEELLAETSWSNDFDVSLSFTHSVCHVLIRSQYLPSAFTLSEATDSSKSSKNVITFIGEDDSNLLNLNTVKFLILCLLTIHIEKLTRENGSTAEQLSRIQEIRATLKQNNESVGV